MTNPSLDTKTGLVVFGDTYVDRPQQLLPVSPSDGDWLRIYNNTGGVLFLVASSNINGLDKGFVSRHPEWLLCAYDATNKWNIQQPERIPVVVTSVDGTLSTAKDQIPADHFNVNDLVCFLNTEADGIYQVEDNAGTSEFNLKAGFGSSNVPRFASQIDGGTLALASGYADIPLSTTDIDGSGSDYTITLASNRVEFDDTDGSKVYRVTYTVNVSTDTLTDTINVRADLDGGTVSRSAVAFDLAASTDAEKTKSFLVQPPTSASNNNYLTIEANQDNASADGDIDDLLLLIERVA